MQSRQRPYIVNVMVAFALTVFILAVGLALVAAACLLTSFLLTPPSTPSNHKVNPMKVRSLFFTLFILCLSSLALAQTTLSGSIHTFDNKPLPFVSIALLNARDSTLVKGAVSRENGSYAFDNIRSG